MASSASYKAPVLDDTVSHCMEFLSRVLTEHACSPNSRKLFIVGINGAQGVGKTTLVSSLKSSLEEQYHMETLVLSIDDFYHDHETQVAIAEVNQNNPLVQHRGNPGTHDIELLRKVFNDLLTASGSKIPSYSKSAHGGQGDQVPVHDWKDVDSSKLRFVILEGWCLGFRPLDPGAIASLVSSRNTKTLHRYRLEDLLFVNNKLKDYAELWDLFLAFIHIDAENLDWVYEWREEAEEKVRVEKGEKCAMTKNEVRAFINGYFPAYEMYTEGVRRGIYKETIYEEVRKQLRLVVSWDRKVKEVIEI